MWEKLYRNKLLLSVLAGVAVFLSYPRYDLFPFILLFPWLTIALVRLMPSFRKACLYGFFVSFIIMLGGFYWVIYVIHEFGYIPWAWSVLMYLGFCGFAALNFPLFSGLMHIAENHWHSGRLPRPWLELWYSIGLPALFTIVEFIIPKLFPWSFAHCLYQAYWLTQIVELTGSTYLSFALFSLGSVGALYALQKREGKPLPHPMIWLVPVVLWGIVGGFSYQRLSRPLPEKVLRVALIQANIGSLEKVEARKGFVDKVQHVLQDFERLTETALQDSPRVDLIVWPETAMPFTLQNDNGSYSRELKGKVLQWNTPLIVGAYAISPFDFSRDYNTAYLVEPMGNDKIHQEMYHKNILLAFGEYMPFGEMFPALYRWFPQVSNFERGKVQNAFTLKDGTRIGVTICYEAIIPSFFRKVAANEVNLIVNLTNDSWFGPTAEPYLHAAMTIFRSIETRLPFVRVTNTGTSFTVDIFGRVSKLTKVYAEDILVSDVHLPATPPLTFYTQHGDWFMIILLIAEIGLVVVLYRRRNAPLPV